MDILSVEHLAKKGSQKNRRHFSENSSGTNSKPEKSSRRNTKYIKLYELTQAATAPVRKTKEPLTTKLGKLTVKTPFQKSIASDLDMRKELENRDKISKDYRKKMLKKCSRIVDTFLKELVKGEKTAPIDEPKEQLIAKLGKSTVTARFQKNIASDLGVKKEFDHRDITENTIRKRMLTICSNIVDIFLKESVMGKTYYGVVDKPRKQAIYKFGKSTEKTRFQNSIASDHGMIKEFENRDNISDVYGKRMLDLCSSVVNKYLKEFVKGENLLM